MQQIPTLENVIPLNVCYNLYDRNANIYSCLRRVMYGSRRVAIGVRLQSLHLEVIYKHTARL